LISFVFSDRLDKNKQGLLSQLRKSYFADAKEIRDGGGKAGDCHGLRVPDGILDRHA
jgi:hypothetical protein